jgi:hypothetical protein
MAKKVGYEVIARRPVCVDFRDGRVVSFRPGQRFEAERTNSSVMRLERVKDVRRLGPMEAVPPLPVKLGAPRRVQAVLKARAQVAAARKAALARFEASRQAPPKIEEAKPMPAPVKKKKPKKKTKAETTSSQPEADK